MATCNFCALFTFFAHCFFNAGTAFKTNTLLSIKDVLVEDVLKELEKRVSDKGWASESMREDFVASVARRAARELVEEEVFGEGGRLEEVLRESLEKSFLEVAAGAATTTASPGGTNRVLIMTMAR